MSHAIPRHCVSLCIHIVGIATFADTVESSPNRIACETAASARELPAFLAAHVGPMVCAWVRHFARGSDDMRVGPLIRTWVRWYARQRRPGAYLGVGVRVAGLTRIFSGSRAARQVRACQFFCVWGLEVGGDSVGVGGGELGEGLFPVGGGVSLDEACVSCSFVGGFPGVCEALGGSFVFDVAEGEPQEFDGGFFAGEMPAVLGDFT